MNAKQEQLKQMADTGSYEGAIALAKELGVEVDEELDGHIKTYFEKKANHLLSDDELENVSGGKINWGNGQGKGLADHQEDVHFAFNVGDVVEVWKVFWTERGVVTDRKINRGIVDPLAEAVGILVPSTWYVPVYHVTFFKRLGPSWEPQDYLSY